MQITFLRAIGAFAFALMLADPAMAQTRITPEQFVGQAAGRTLTFRNYSTGNLVGVEQFLGPDRSVWARQDGTCTYGQINLREGTVCFTYEDSPDETHCWQPYVHNGDMLVISNSGDIQRVSDITDEPVICRDVPIS